jgi:Spirocyclase AveC-like
MTQLLERPAGTTPDAPRSPSTGATIVWALLGCGLFLALVTAAHNLRHGAVAERIRNPAVAGAPRPVRPLFGDTAWIAKMQIGTIVMMVIVVVVFVVLWRRHPRHPYLLMTLAVTAIVWQDPIMNWAPYAVYNPELWHWPETWPLVSLSPTVEPLIVVGYATFYFGPFFAAIWVLRRLQRRKPVDAFVWRHPLVSLAALILGIGFVFDAMLEMFLVRTQLYVYSHVMPFGSVFTGKPYQFPLLWESAGVTLVMIPAGVLVYRDDTGRTVAEKLARRARWFRGRPALGTFLVMFAVLNVAYFAYGLMFATIKWTKAATSVACPWPYPEAKVYDPHGFYEKAGQPGPYFPGNWSGWESVQSGRPAVNPPAGGGRCAPATP